MKRRLCHMMVSPVVYGLDNTLVSTVTEEEVGTREHRLLGTLVMSAILDMFLS